MEHFCNTRPGKEELMEMGMVCCDITSLKELIFLKLVMKKRTQSLNKCLNQLIPINSSRPWENKLHKRINTYLIPIFHTPFSLKAGIVWRFAAFKITGAGLPTFIAYSVASIILLPFK